MTTTKIAPADATLAEMATLYNLASPAKPVRKFSSRSEGERRTAAALAAAGMEAVREADGSVCVRKALSPTGSPGLSRLRRNAGEAGAEALRQQVVADQQRAAVAATAGRSAGSAEKPRDRAPPRRRDDHSAPRAAGRQPSYPDTARIVVLADGNPKKRDCARRFDLYRAKGGQTVAGYVAAVGDRRLALADIRWDAAKGWIRVG